MLYPKRSIIFERHEKTANDLLKGRKTRHLFVFGCVFYILNQRYQCSKFEPQAYEGVFLGYSSVFKALRVFNFSRKTVKETTQSLSTKSHS